MTKKQRELAAIYASAIASQRRIAGVERGLPEGYANWEEIDEALGIEMWGEEDQFASRALEFDILDGVHRWAEVHAKIMNGEV